MIELSIQKKIPEIIESYNNILKNISSFNPDVKKLQFDYMHKTSELKIKLRIPDSRNKDLELPEAGMFKITEAYDGEFDAINLHPELKDGKWVISHRNLPKSENMFLFLSSEVSNDDIKDLVRIDVPEDPVKNDETDEYWVHSAIRNMKLFENIYQDLNIDNVLTSVKVGVSRTFTSSAPKEVLDYLQSRAEMESAMNEKDRGMLFKKWTAFRSSRRNIGNLQTYQIFQLIQGLLAPTQFQVFIVINQPFRVHSVSSTGTGIPHYVNVNVLTELTKKLPAVNGNLIFKKKDFSNDVQAKFNDLIDKKTKKSN